MFGENGYLRRLNNITYSRVRTGMQAAVPAALSGLSAYAIDFLACMWIEFNFNFITGEDDLPSSCQQINTTKITEITEMYEENWQIMCGENRTITNLTKLVPSSTTKFAEYPSNSNMNFDIQTMLTSAPYLAISLQMFINTLFNIIAYREKLAREKLAADTPENDALDTHISKMENRMRLFLKATEELGLQSLAEQFIDGYSRGLIFPNPYLVPSGQSYASSTIPGLIETEFRNPSSLLYGRTQDACIPDDGMQALATIFIKSMNKQDDGIKTQYQTLYDRISQTPINKTLINKIYLLFTNTTFIDTSGFIASILIVLNLYPKYIPALYYQTDEYRHLFVKNLLEYYICQDVMSLLH